MYDERKLYYAKHTKHTIITVRSANAPKGVEK